MERAKRPYAIYRRPTKNSRRKIHYVRFRDPDTSQYLTAVSSGCTRRDDAVRWAEKRLRDGSFVRSGSQSLTFGDAAAGFWDYEKSPYILSRLARGKSFSRTYAAIRVGHVKGHLSPVLGNRRLASIQRSDIEKMVMDWYKAGVLGPASINRILVTAKVMFKWWEANGVIPADPCSKVAVLQETPKIRKIFTVAEARRFFEGPIADPRYYTLNMLAAATGLRLGECVGLLRSDVHNNITAESSRDSGSAESTYCFIDLQHNWQDWEGNKAPKWGSRGEVPLPVAVGRMLEELISLNPYGNEFVFFGSTPDRPVSRKAVSLAFNKRVNEIEISEEERKERGLTFHSWRHFANAMLHGRLTGDQVRKVTRHRSEKMTERYDHLTSEDAKAVVSVQESIVGQLIPDSPAMVC